MTIEQAAFACSVSYPQCAGVSTIKHDECIRAFLGETCVRVQLASAVTLEYWAFQGFEFRVSSRRSLYIILLLCTWDSAITQPFPGRDSMHPGKCEVVTTQIAAYEKGCLDAHADGLCACLRALVLETIASEPRIPA